MGQVLERWRIVKLSLVGVVLSALLLPSFAYAMDVKYGGWASSTQGTTTYAARSSIGYKGRVVDTIQTVKATRGNISKGYVASNARLIKASNGAIAASTGYKTNPTAKLVNQNFNVSTVGYASGIKMPAKTTYYSQGQTKALNNLTKKWYMWVSPKTASYTTPAS
ncbi:hypothetical protein [Adlercreutzia caecimuris]|uniref:hypothetical protein n=1 Tax=Adlercreutzia caecimuris TaxID=671266 RepID=UPI00272B11B7|nr:hypothetical protein [Adlercreutzia caecimuris]